MIFSSPFAGGGVRGFGDGYYPDEDMILLRGVGDVLKDAGVIFTDESRPRRKLGGVGRYRPMLTCIKVKQSKKVNEEAAVIPGGETTAP
jgi:hypothetical protein